MSSPSSRVSMYSPQNRASMLPPSEGHNSPRSSNDHHGPSFQGQEASSSRRPSKASLRQSPTSMSSSSRHDDYNGPGWDDGRRRLPRIRTSMVDDSGPHSAPLRSPTGLTAMSHNAPPRASTSPDPWSRSGGSSPGHSPTDQRPSIMLAGPASGSSSHLETPFMPTVPRMGANPSLIPPRSSSQTDRSRPISPVRTPGAAPQLVMPEPTIGGHHPQDDGTVSAPRSSGRRHEPANCGLSTCGRVVTGQFVRAMGRVYHLDCFRCKVCPKYSTRCQANMQGCGKQVAQKFFPVEDAEGMYPLCERDYFARLDLICAKCDQALRSSYITACGGPNFLALSLAIH